MSDRVSGGSWNQDWPDTNLYYMITKNHKQLVKFVYYVDLVEPLKRSRINFVTEFF